MGLQDEISNILRECTDNLASDLFKEHGILYQEQPSVSITKTNKTFTVEIYWYYAGNAPVRYLEKYVTVHATYLPDKEELKCHYIDLYDFLKDDYFNVLDTTLIVKNKKKIISLLSYWLPIKIKRLV